MNGHSYEIRAETHARRANGKERVPTGGAFGTLVQTLERSVLVVQVVGRIRTATHLLNASHTGTCSLRMRSMPIDRVSELMGQPAQRPAARAAPRRPQLRPHMPCHRHRPASWVESARALQAAAVRSPPCAVPSPNAAAHSAAARHSLIMGIAPACGDTIPRSPMCRSALSRRGPAYADSQMRRCAPNQLAANAVGVPRCRSPFCHRPLCKSGRAPSWSVPAIVALQYRIATRAIPGGRR